MKSPAQRAAKRTYYYKHRERILKEYREQYATYRALGVCVHCKKSDSVNGGIHCDACREYTAKYWNPWQSKKYREMKAKGICTNCRHREARLLRTMCRQCSEALVRKWAKRRNERLAQGMCGYCGERPPIAACRKMCAPCLDRRMNRRNK